MIIHLTPLARARLWFRRAIPEFVPSSTLSRKVESAPAGIVKAAQVTLEAYVPRGGRAEYGLLGIRFERDRDEVLHVEVPHSEDAGAPWFDSLGAQVDDIRLGLPEEYAMPILDTLVAFSERRFPPGTIRIVEAAHGHVGSSSVFFRRIAVGALSLMLDDHRLEEADITVFLQKLLVGREDPPTG